MFGSFGAGFGSFGSGVGGLFPSLTYLISWLKTPTTDGKTLANSKGVDADLTDVNCLSFDGSNDHIDLPSVPSDLLECVFDISFDLLIDDTDTGFQRIIWFIDGSKFFRMQKNNGVNSFDFWATQQANTIDIFRSQNISFTPDVMFNFRAVGDGTDVKVYYDNVLQTTIPITGANKTSIFNPATPSLGVSLTSFLGKMANFKMSSGGVLHTHLPIAEGSGTKAYDISGNGNYGTIDGATWSTEDGIESWNHEYGFDIDGAVKVPALNTKTKQVATFDGVADRLDFTAHTTAVGDVFDFEFDLVSNADGANGNHRCLLSNSSNNYIALLDNNDGRIVVRGDSIQNATGTIKVADGMSTLKVTIDSASQVSVSINGGSTETLSTNFTGIGLSRLMSGAGGIDRFLNANVKSFSITNSSGTKVIDYDFQSDIGTTTVQDLSTNDNDGTVTVGSGGLDSFWGTRVADASGSLVSADYATGNTSISNPAGFVHNGSECGVKLQSRTVGTFDGSDDVVVTEPVTLGNNFEFEWTGSLSDSENFGRIFANTNSTTTEGVFELNRSGTNNSIRFVVYPNGSSRQEGFPFFFNFDGLVKTHKVTYNNGALTYVVGGVTLYSNTFSAGNGFTDSNAFGIYSRANGANSCGGTLQNFKLTISGSTAFEYDFSEGQGTTLTDLSGNSNNGTITVGASGTETFWADSYQEYEKIDLDQGFVPAQLTVTDCTDTSLNGLYYLDSTRNNDKLRWLKNNNTAQKVYFNSGSNRWTIQDSGGSVTKVGDTILPAEGSYGGGANLAYSTQGVFIKTSGTNITQIGQYDEDETLTATEATQNDRYFG